jgi:hypothetical protein
MPIEFEYKPRLASHKHRIMSFRCHILNFVQTFETAKGREKHSPERGNGLFGEFLLFSGKSRYLQP